MEQQIYHHSPIFALPLSGPSPMTRILAGFYNNSVDQITMTFGLWQNTQSCSEALAYLLIEYVIHHEY